MRFLGIDLCPEKFFFFKKLILQPQKDAASGGL